MAREHTPEVQEEWSDWIAKHPNDPIVRQARAYKEAIDACVKRTRYVGAALDRELEEIEKRYIPAGTPKKEAGLIKTATYTLLKQKERKAKASSSSRTYYPGDRPRGPLPISPRDLSTEAIRARGTVPGRVGGQEPQAHNGRSVTAPDGGSRVYDPNDSLAPRRALRGLPGGPLQGERPGGPSAHPYGHRPTNRPH